MRIATWNINGLRARLDYIFHWLDSRRPDVVGLQELKMQEDLFPHAEFQARGYQAVVHASKAWNGVAILSREPAVVLQSGLPGEERMGTRLVSARVAGLTFITVYCPNGKHVEHDDFPRKLAWYDALLSHMEARHTFPSPSSSAATSTSAPRRWTPGTKRSSGAGSSTPTWNGINSGDCWTGDFWIFTEPATRRNGSFPGGTTGEAHSTGIGASGSISSCRPRRWRSGCAGWRSTATTGRRRKA